MTPSATCHDCASDVAHCHATWIRHADGRGECLVLDCRWGAEAHDVVVVCAELGDPCCD